MSVRDIAFILGAAVVGGLMTDYALDAFKPALRFSILGRGMQDAAVRPDDSKPPLLDLQEMMQFNATERDSEDDLHRKIEACWNAIDAGFPEIMKRIPHDDSPDAVFLDTSYPADSERVQLRTVVGLFTICRGTTRQLALRATPKIPAALLSALDEATQQTDVVYAALIEGAINWGRFAQDVRSINIAYDRKADKIRQQAP